MQSAAAFVSLPTLGEQFPAELNGTLAFRRTVATQVAGVTAASALNIRPAPEIVPFGIAALDELAGGVPRSGLTELCGVASSGRTSVLVSLMAEFTSREELCAVVDVNDSFDPESASKAGVDLHRVLWIRCGRSPVDLKIANGGRFAKSAGSENAKLVASEPKIMKNALLSADGEDTPASFTPRCHPDASRERRASRIPHADTSGRTYRLPALDIGKVRNTRRQVRSVDSGTNSENETFVAARPSRRKDPMWSRLEQALKVTDMLLQSGGFGAVIVDLADVPPQFAQRIPLTSWFRFQRAVESTPTALVVMEQQPYAKTCASLVLQLAAIHPELSDNMQHAPAHAAILRGLNISAELLRSRMDRKPLRSCVAQWNTRTAWTR